MLLNQPPKGEEKSIVIATLMAMGQHHLPMVCVFLSVYHHYMQTQTLIMELGKVQQFIVLQVISFLPFMQKLLIQMQEMLYM